MLSCDIVSGVEGGGGGGYHHPHQAAAAAYASSPHAAASHHLASQYSSSKMNVVNVSPNPLGTVYATKRRRRSNKR